MNESSLGWSDRFVSRLLRVRWFVAAFGIVVFLFALPLSQSLQMDRDISGMFDPEDPTLQAYRELQHTFGGNVVAMIAYRDRELMTVEGISRNARITQRVQEVAGVRDILSPARLSEIIGKVSPSGMLIGSVDSTPALLDRDDPVASAFDQVFSGYTHSADHQHAAVVAILQPDHSPQTIEELREVGQWASGSFGESIDRVALVGEPILIHDGFALIERDGAKLATWTIVLLSIVVFVSLRDWRFVLLSAGIIAWATTVTRAILVCLAIELSIVSSILTAIVTVIAVTAVLHLGVRFRMARRRELSIHDAAHHAFSMLLAPIFWTCATDAAGFAALSWSRILPVRQFGWMIAIAAICVLIGVLLFAPAAITIPELPARVRRGNRLPLGSRRMRFLCRRLAKRFVDSPLLGVSLVLVIGLIASVGVWQTETETSFLRNFRQRSPVVAAYEGVERDFGGAGVWDILLDAPPVTTDDYLSRVRRFEDELRSIEVDGARLTKVISIADVDAAAAKAPLLRFAPTSVRIAGMRVAMPAFADALLSNPDSQSSDSESSQSPVKLRIMLRSREHLDAETKIALIEKVEKAVEKLTSDPAWPSAAADSTAPQVTGYYVMMARLVSHLVGDQWRCFLASGVMVWMLLIVATRSLRLATAALVPNVLPALLVLAIVGLIGGKLNMGAAMIAAVSIGLSIDGSVHFLAGYQRLRSHGHDASNAAISSAGNVGVPLLLATIALVIGFSVLATSEFVPTATFGLLVAATMAAGTLINLTLLPALVSWIDR